MGYSDWPAKGGSGARRALPTRRGAHDTGAAVARTGWEASGGYPCPMQARATNFANVLSLLRGLRRHRHGHGPARGWAGDPGRGRRRAGGQVRRRDVRRPAERVHRSRRWPSSRRSSTPTGSLIANPYDENRIIVPLKKISKNMQNAQIAIEDSRFYEHGGVDARGHQPGAGLQPPGRRHPGRVHADPAVRQDHAAGERPAERTTRRPRRPPSPRRTRASSRSSSTPSPLEKKLTKDQILEGYLNLVYYGDQAYGVEAAAQHYFSVTAGQAQPRPGGPAGRPGAAADAAPTRSTTPSGPRPAATSCSTACTTSAWSPTRTWTAAKAVPVKKMLKVKPAQSACRPLQPAVLLRLHPGLPRSSMPALGKTVRRADQEDQPGRPDHPDHARPQGPEDGPGAGRARRCRSATPTASAPRRASSSRAPARSWPWPRPEFPKNGEKGKKYTQVNWNVDQRYGGTSGCQFGSTAKMYAIVAALESGIPVNGNDPVEVRDDQAVGDLQPERDEGPLPAPASAWPVRNDESIGGKPIDFDQATATLGQHRLRVARPQAGHRQGAQDHGQDGPAPGQRQARSSATRRSSPWAPTTTTPLTLAASYATLAAERQVLHRPARSCRSPRTTRSRSSCRPTTASRSSASDVANGATELLKGVIEERHRPRRQARRRPSGGRQDRHHRQPRRVLVRRLHPAARHRGLGRHALQPASA